MELADYRTQNCFIFLIDLFFKSDNIHKLWKLGRRRIFFGGGIIQSSLRIHLLLVPNHSLIWTPSVLLLPKSIQNCSRKWTVCVLRPMDGNPAQSLLEYRENIHTHTKETFYLKALTPNTVLFSLDTSSARVTIAQFVC